MRQLSRVLDTFAQRPLLVVFFAALVPRVTMALVIRFRFDGYLYLDDRSYLEEFERYAASGSTGKSVIWDSVPSYSRPISLLFRFVYNDPVAALFPTVLAGSVSAVLVAFAIGRTQSRRKALLAGLLVAWWPSQIFWSSLALRDAFIWMAASMTLAAASHLGLRRTRLNLVGSAFVILLSIAYIAGSRKHSALALALAVIIALLVLHRTRAIFAASAILLVAIPLSMGFGVAGWDLWKDGTARISENRQREVDAANSPIRCWDMPLLPAGDESQGGWKHDLLCLPASTTNFLMAPFPAQVQANPNLWPPLLELPAWILLYMFALRASRNRARSVLLSVAKFYVLATVLMWSLIDRVVGTGFRHRGEILSALVILAFVSPHGSGSGPRKIDEYRTT